MSRRIQQLESSLQRAIGRVLAEDLSDPRLQGLISVTAVQVSPDRADAVVKVSVLPAEHEEAAMAGLDSAAARIQSLLTGRLRARRMPRLHFRIDRSLKKQAEVFSAIREARDADEAEAEWETPTDGPPSTGEEGERP